MKRRIAILGSTGSIGRQALDVVRQHPDLFEVDTLTANNSVELLARHIGGAEVRGGICLHGGADVVALAVGDDEHAL